MVPLLLRTIQKQIRRNRGKKDMERSEEKYIDEGFMYMCVIYGRRPCSLSERQKSYSDQTP